MKKIEEIKLNINSTIKEALTIIDSGAVKFAIVVDKDDKLLGTLTDGDIRRGILNGKTLDDKIEDIYFKKPTVVDVNTSKEEIINICTTKKMYQIPVVDKEGKVIDIAMLDELLKPQTLPNKVVLMVGGLGTRLRPLTDTTPKPLLKVGGKPIIETIMQSFANHGFKDFILSVNYKSEMFEEYFGDGSHFGYNIEYVHEEKRLGTAGALSLMRDKLDDDFFVMNGDLLTNVNFENLLKFHQEGDAEGTMCVREYDFQVPYGVVDVKDGKICSITEKPTHKFFVSAGIYMLSPKVLKHIPNDEFYDMPTLFEKLIETNDSAISFPLREYWLDIGRIEEFEKANDEYGDVF
jgi:dTDP-glucose pyrophosphorylase